MNNSEIRKKFLEYKNYINEIGGLTKESKLVLSDYIGLFEKLTNQFESFFGKDYDSIKDAIEDSKELQKTFSDLIDEIAKQKQLIVDLNDELKTERDNYHITADEQRRCLEYSTKIKKLGLADQFAEANEYMSAYSKGLINLTADEVDKYQELIDREKQLQNSMGIRGNSQINYIKMLTETNGQLQDTLDKYMDIEDINNSITQQYSEQLRIKTEEDKIAKKRGKNFDNFLKALKSSWGLIKNWSSEWATFNDITIKSGRAIGMSNENLRNFNLKLIKDTTQLSHLYGITREQWLGFQTAYAESTSRATVLTQGEIENIGAVSKLTSDEIVNQAVTNMDYLGGSSNNAMAQVAMTHQRAMLLGLNASKLAKDTVKNWSLAQKFNFRNGVDGISKMTALSERLKFNMESIANVAESLQTIEGSIQTSARLQMLGGSYARNFSNPMDVMFESNYDLEGLTKRITETFAGQGVFNSKTGKVDISPINQRFIREASKALGISFDEAINMATQSVKYDKVMGEINPLMNFDNNQKEAIANLAKWNNETKEHYVTIQTENGETKDVNVKDLTAKEIDSARNLEKNTVDINKNVYDISNGVKEILNIAKTRASDQRSWLEKMLGLNESFKGIKANSSDLHMHALDTYADSATKKGAIGDDIINMLYKLGPSVLGIGAIGTLGYKFLKAKGLRKYNGSFTQWVRHGYTTRRTHAERTASNPNTTKTSFGTKLGQKFGKYAPKLKKLGKYGLIAGGAAALIYTLSSFTNKPQDIQNENAIVDNSSNQLTELKKHTELLEKISNKTNGASSSIANENTYETDNSTSSDNSSVATSIIGSTAAIGGYMAIDKGSKYLAKNGAEMATKGGFIGKLGKYGTKISPKAFGRFSMGSLVVDGLNFVGKETGLYEEGSTPDKLMNIGSSTLTGAAIGSMIPIIGTGVGALLGAGVGVISEYGKDISDWFSNKFLKDDNSDNNQNIAKPYYSYNSLNSENNSNYMNNQSSYVNNFTNPINNIGYNRYVGAPQVSSIPVVGTPTKITQTIQRETITEKIVIPDINLNISGNIKLVGDNNKNSNIDIDKLIENQQFKNMLIKLVKDGLDKNQNNGKIDRNSSTNMRTSSGYSAK